MMNSYSRSPSTTMENNSSPLRCFSKTLILLYCLAACNFAFAQVINTTPGSFNYGTGDATANAGYPTTLGGTATVAYSGNDATVTASGTIVTGATTTSGVFNFHNFT